MTPEDELKLDAEVDKRFDINLPAELAQRVAALPNDVRLALAGRLLPHLAAEDQAAIERLSAEAVDKHERKQRREAARVQAMTRGGGTPAKAMTPAERKRRRIKAKAQRKARRGRR